MSSPIPSAVEHAGSRRWEALDLLRFLAAVAVVAYHYLPRTDLGPSWQNQAVLYVGKFGYLGVEVFFAISGAVIALSASNRTARSFLANRVARLFPSFWLALLLTVVSQYLFEGLHPSTQQVFANATMLPGYLGQPYLDEVYWTLAVEWKFYLLVALLLVVLRSFSYESIARFWTIIVLLQHGPLDSSVLSSISLFPYGSHFAFGMLLLAVRQDGRSWPRMTWLSAALLGCLLTTWHIHEDFFVHADASSRLVATCVMSVALASMTISSFSTLNPRIAALAQRLGAATYPLYLLHSGPMYPVISKLKELGLPSFAAIGLSLFILVGLTSLFVRYLERRFVPYLSGTSLAKSLAGKPRATSLAT